ncbi:hypothetical protein AWY79_05245 [Pseudodesulfovibrio indicus]|uniref:Uncharacterized protein n=1 Tax=Pseudodesulfovibrio indicus TaxID=1716143 RepID=A0ABM5YT71_9BACT|nr:hypothetical protein AWY79_05245 [Pseudodesulfovibrio indicus]
MLWGDITAHSLAAKNPIRSVRLHPIKSIVRASTKTPLLRDTEGLRERSRRPFAVGFQASRTGLAACGLTGRRAKEEGPS